MADTGEEESHPAQASLELSFEAKDNLQLLILLPPPPVCWDYGHVPICPIHAGN